MTSAAEKPMKGTVKMKFDKGDRVLENVKYEYVEDPLIESVESGVASQIKVPKGIPAGGIHISVSGRNLAYVQNPQMYVYYNDMMTVSVSIHHHLFGTNEA